jgi:hypothetical protein
VIDVIERYERTLNLETGTDAARWFDVDHRHEQDAEPVRVDQATTVTLRSLAEKSAAVKTALGGPTFAARGFVPREDRSSSANLPLVRSDGGRSPLEWRWGQLGDAAYRAIDDAVTLRVAGEFHKKVNDVNDPVEAPLGQRIHGTRNAYRSFVAHLRTEGIVALENAIGKPCR